MKITRAIIPAAGLGTRFLPATKSQPKEMLPIVDKPCIQYLVEEAVNSGIKEIIIITGRGKRSIEDYFDHSFELETHLKEKKKTQTLKEIQKINKMAKFIYVRQPFPRGDGHAILCAKELVSSEPFAVLFGDDIYDSTTPPLAQMIKEYEKHETPIIGIQKVNKNETDKYGIIAPDKNGKGPLYKVNDLVEKPKPSKAPSNLAIVGKYIVTPLLLKTLDKSKPSHKDGELRLIDGMKQFVKKSPIYGLNIKGKRFDTGDKLGYLKAVMHFSMSHPQIGKDFRKYLRGLDF